MVATAIGQLLTVEVNDTLIPRIESLALA